MAKLNHKPSWNHLPSEIDAAIKRGEESSAMVKGGLPMPEFESQHRKPLTGCVTWGELINLSWLLVSCL